MSEGQGEGMKAFILAAGYGKRLEPLTKAVPKPMVPVANKPIMQYNIELLRKYGIKDIIANIHYFPEQVENYFGDGSSFGVNLKYSFEEELLGTAGGVKRMSQLADIDDTFMVISSDILTDVNISRMLAHHKKKKAIATIALTQVDDVTQFGVVVLDEKERIVEFQEKPSIESAKSDLVNTGIYIFEPEMLEMIPENISDFGKEIFPRLVSERAPFYGYKMIEYWNDVGGIEKLKSANSDVLQGRVRAEVHARRVGRSTWLGRGTQVSKSAKFDGTIILGDKSVVGENVEIYGNVSIGDKCVIEEGVVISDSVIWSDTHVGKSSRLNKCLVGNWCHLEDNVKIEEGCIISNRCRIRQGKKLDPNTKIEPDQTV
jgi:NDP-sugar pyrophosphorylase family protein